jgi:UDP-N-acetylmuramoyl-L-alanyl-D-glutamate--2,6-diaminopimelate ligase
MKTLSDLFANFPFEILEMSPTNVEISDIISDSRKTQPGSLFVAIAGESTDGHQFIADAVSKGAGAIVGESPSPMWLEVPYVRVENSRQTLAYLAAAYYGNPARSLTMIGVTGTDGKTTTSNLLYKILLMAGKKAGMISTVNAVIGDEVLDTGFHVTTPEAIDVQRYLAKMVNAGLTHVILETTSHGWAQFRIDACEFDIGVITNITHEHLDYHGTYENYRAAKARLFSGLADVGPKAQGNFRLGVLNHDDSSYEYLKSITKGNVISYGLNSDADFRAIRIKHSPSGIDFTVGFEGGSQRIISFLVGAFNVSNCLAAYSTAVHGLGIAPEIAAQGIANLTSVPGRMERIDVGQDFTAIVDFAHTPNALRSALQTARRITNGRLIVVFGSAGLRDRQKRRMMAEVACEFADVSILTAEDPRTESLEIILEEMAGGAIARGGIEKKSFWRIPDRGEAIRRAVKMASAGDLVIVCGKGHEQSMCFGEIEYPWDDRLAMRSALAEYLGLDPINMPYLPTQRQNS